MHKPEKPGSIANRVSPYAGKLLGFFAGVSLLDFFSHLIAGERTFLCPSPELEIFVNKQGMHVLFIVYGRKYSASCFSAAQE